MANYVFTLLNNVFYKIEIYRKHKKQTRKTQNMVEHWRLLGSQTNTKVLLFQQPSGRFP